ncbi:MAG: two-component sensor histidine kinase [Maricaulis sp.]|nr:two-component sensor histidine kinase [Oceanicaulis sp.]MAZ91795.1 two-component sensor histidine kinase [Maricaulis sp.]
MTSLRRMLLSGFAIVAVLGTVVLLILVGLEYGFFSSTPPPLDATLAEIVDHVLIPLLVFIGLSVIGSILVIRAATRRLEDVAALANEASARGEPFRAPLDALPREIHPFAEAVNRLTGRLERHARQQEAFAADAAHELKTPLSVLALELDRLPREDAAPLKAQVQALSELIDQLLLLARSNNPGGQARQVPVDLDALGQRVVADMAPRAIHDGKSLSYETAGAARICGLEEALASALRTLVDNALRETPAGGEVVVRAGPGPQIAVLDGGAGLDAAALERFKARGVRADQGATGGAGLGLAIADRIAEAHEGELETCRPEETGLRIRFTRSLPPQD